MFRLVLEVLSRCCLRRNGFKFQSPWFFRKDQLERFHRLTRVRLAFVRVRERVRLQIQITRMIGDVSLKRGENDEVIKLNLPIRLGVIGCRVTVIDVQELGHVPKIFRLEASAVIRDEFIRRTIVEDQSI